MNFNSIFPLIYVRILRIKIEKCIVGKIEEKQAGFPIGRSNLDHIHIFNEKKKSKYKDVHVIYQQL